LALCAGSGWGRAESCAATPGIPAAKTLYQRNPVIHLARNNHMAIQRYVLYAAIAVVSFMLLTEWVSFSKQKHLDEVTAKPTPTITITENTSNSSVPTASNTTSQNSGDVPAATSSQPVITSNISTDLITITTDVLRVQIDPKGGDIVSLALIKHSAHIDSPETPFQLLQNDKRLYIAQSGLIGVDTNENRLPFTASARDFVLGDKDDLVVELKAEHNGVPITKQFTFHRGDYLIDVSYLISNTLQQDWRTTFYAQIKRDGSGDPSVEAGSGGLGIHPFLGAAIHTNDERFKKFKFDDMKEKHPAISSTNAWVAWVQHYFVSAWIAPKDQSYELEVSASGNNYFARIKSPEIVVPAGSNATIKAQFYAGPKDQKRLAQIAEGLDLSVDYGFLWMIAQAIFWLMIKIHGIFPNWGVTIILLTVLIKALFFYPSAAAYRSMAKMRKIQPQLLALRDRFPDDRQKQSQELMALYKKEGVNPIGGCLPILIQMPVFISLYWVLLESYELRHAPFFGYIQDLAAMDPYFILPIIMVASMWFQQKLNPPPPDPMQAKVMTYMPFVFGVFFLFFPAGLVLYWVVNNLLSIAQQWIITKQIEKA
jgi:YidC/Oxa1 family membrane protein insertase